MQFFEKLDEHLGVIRQNFEILFGRILESLFSRMFNYQLFDIRPEAEQCYPTSQYTSIVRTFKLFHYSLSFLLFLSMENSSKIMILTSRKAHLPEDRRTISIFLQIGQQVFDWFQHSLRGFLPTVAFRCHYHQDLHYFDAVPQRCQRTFRCCHFLIHLPVEAVRDLSNSRHTRWP